MNTATKLTTTRRSTVRTTIIRVAAALAVALVGLGGLAANAQSADAATVHSVKVCGVNAGSGRAETGATITSYYWNATKRTWVSYASAPTGPAGCGWVKAPKGYYTSYVIHRATPLGWPYSPLDQCEATGSIWVDHAESGYRLIPTSTDGYNFGTLRVPTVRWVNC